LVQNFIFLIFQFFLVGGERKTHWIPAKKEKFVIDNDSITKTVNFCVKWFLLFRVFYRSFRSKWVQNGFSGEKKYESCLTKQHNWGENGNPNLQGQAQARMAFYFYF